MLALGVVLPRLPHHPGLPCPLYTLTGVPCPLCGLTTAVEAALGGHMRASIAANPFGLLAIAAAIVLIARPGIRTLRVPVAVVGFGIAASWTWELHRFSLL